MAISNFSTRETSKSAALGGWIDRAWALVKPLASHPGVTAFALFSLVLALGSSSSVFRFATEVNSHTFSVEHPETLALLTDKGEVKRDSIGGVSDEIAQPAKPTTPPTVKCSFYVMVEGSQPTHHCRRLTTTTPSHRDRRAECPRVQNLSTSGSVPKQIVTKSRNCCSGTIAGLSPRLPKDARCGG
jgi:hypothetical protein